MYSIYLDHGGAYGNLGDEAMLINAAYRIRKQLGEVEFVIPRTEGMPLPDIDPRTEISPPSTRIPGLINRIIPRIRLRNWLDRRSFYILPDFISKIAISTAWPEAWKDFRTALRSCDAVYCVGAANLNDFARYGYLLPKFMLIEQANQLNIPVIVSSQTVGPLNLPWTKRLVKRIVEQATFFSLRDGGVSKQLLVSLGVDESRLFTVGDEAFSLQASRKEDVERYLEEQGINPNEPFALFHFRSTDYTQSTIKHYQKLAEMLDRIETNAKVLFLPMSYGHHSGDDEVCGQEIQSHMNRQEKLRVLHSTQDVHMVRRLIEMAQWIISLSYHCQVFSLAAATPMIILSSGAYYQVKAKGMSMYVGPDVPVVDIDQVTADEFAYIVHQLDTNRAKYIKALTKTRDEMSLYNDAPIKALAQALDEG